MPHARSVVLLRPRLRAALVPVACAALLAPVSADVIVVDETGAGDFTDIQPAIDAAADGDLVLVRVGEYGPVTIDGKRIHVGAAPGARVLTDRVRVQNVEAGGPGVLLSGLQIASSIAAPSVAIDHCAGSVRVRDCRIDSGYSVAKEAVHVNASLDVVLLETEASGTYDHAGVLAVDSTLAAYRCTIVGGDGSEDCLDAEDGKPGCDARAATLLLSDCMVAGGDGGESCCDVGEAGVGGDAIVLSGGSRAYVIASELLEGFGGCYSGFCGIECEDDGQPIVIEAGSSLEEWAVQPRVLASSSIVRSDCDREVWIEGQAGDTVWTPTSSSGAFRLVPGAFGAHLLGVGASADRGDAVLLPGSGVVRLQLAPSPTAPPGAGASSAATLHEQWVGRDAASRILYGEAGFVTAVDPALLGPCSAPIFVDDSAPPGGDGASWATAFDDLHAGLAAAAQRRDDGCRQAPVEVWVAEGVYRPAPAGGSRDVAFEMGGGIALYGGFAGSETCRFERDPRAHETVLSGDLAGDDGPDFASTSENSLRVLHANASPSGPKWVDGFVVRGGNSSGTSGRAAGLEGAELRLIDCTLEANQSGTGGGGAARVHASQVVRCRFSGNRTDGDGGGLALSGRCDVVDCVFLGNEAVQGGGVFAVDQPWHQTPRIVQCVFSGNRADRGAACGFQRHDDGARCEIAHCTFSRNIATTSGAAAVLVGEGVLALTNSVLWRNSVGADVGEAAQLDAGIGTVQASYCCIGGWTGALGGEGNFGGNPRFVDANGADDEYGTDDDDLRLDAASPCIDAGSNSRAVHDAGRIGDVLPLDLGGLLRFQDVPEVHDSGEGVAPIVDIGAHERSPL